MTDGALSPHSSTAPPRARKRWPGGAARLKPETFCARDRARPAPARDERAAPGRGAGPARRGGRGKAPAQALLFLARERSAGASSAPGSPKAPFSVPSPTPRLRLEPRHLNPRRLPSLRPTPSATPPWGHLTLALGTRPPPTRALLLLSRRQKRFPARPRSPAGGLSRGPQGAAGSGAAPEPAPPGHLHPAPRHRHRPLLWGRLRSLNTRFSAGATRAIFTDSLQARGARGGRGCPSPSRLLLHFSVREISAGSPRRGRTRREASDAGEAAAGCSATPRGRTAPGASSLLSRGSLHLQLSENKCPPHGVTHLL